MLRPLGYLAMGATMLGSVACEPMTTLEIDIVLTPEFQEHVDVPTPMGVYAGIVPYWKEGVYGRPVGVLCQISQETVVFSYKDQSSGCPAEMTYAVSLVEGYAPGFGCGAIPNSEQSDWDEQWYPDESIYGSAVAYTDDHRGCNETTKLTITLEMPALGAERNGSGGSDPTPNAFPEP